MEIVIFHIAIMTHMSILNSRKLATSQHDSYISRICMYPECRQWRNTCVTPAMTGMTHYYTEQDRLGTSWLNVSCSRDSARPCRSVSTCRHWRHRSRNPRISTQKLASAAKPQSAATLKALVSTQAWHTSLEALVESDWKSRWPVSHTECSD
jgi:hypothetical protein